MRDRIRVLLIIVLVLVCFSFIYAIRNLEKADVSSLVGVKSPFLDSLSAPSNLNSVLNEEGNSAFLQETFGPRTVQRAIFDAAVPNIPGLPVGTGLPS